MMSILVSAIQAVFLIAVSPLITGIVKKVKALMQHRRGADILQPYRDLAKLLRKDETVSESTSFLFRVIPFVCMAAMTLLAFMTPVFFTGILAPYGDIVTLVYLFTLYRFCMVLGGLEGGSVFGGMGSSREMMMSVLIEPALLLALMSMCVLSNGGTDISSIPTLLIALGSAAFCPALLLAAASFAITLVAENARIPFDNPATHLELTMIHEGMLLEYSGRGLALMELSSEMRLTIFMTMLGTMFFPWGISTTLEGLDLLVGLVAILVKLVVFAFLLAVLESSISKSRLFKTPNMLTASFVLALLAIISLYIL
ncbi:MAG: NADH-quinone oxidoreductase subunit H [archaeon]|nr:NADH-quinone oxidoreductase subunit H [archaeon]